MHQDIAEVLIPADRIQARVAELAHAISAHYGNEKIVLIPLMTGAIVFTADLLRHLQGRVRIEILAVSSYPGTATSSQGPRFILPPTFKVTGEHVLIVDDILDTGRTLGHVQEWLALQQPASVRTCVLLTKQLPTSQQLQADYSGFNIPDEFVVGYGLDYNGYYRNLPYIGVLHEVVYRSHTTN
ncbi:MAG: hypoxanthine phosphoribosyltransferase [Phycisphaerae bacterium]